ncbi:hypothetical protein CDL15_Pgr022802 [Punica granatum]|uniref:Uncharacterized protein n=1 Tax=Punica granatum TaxID=22663 RepID=A0A218XIY4_PUNGR|nr:hypothetical protein CDL15_Pgr022802 [Punica granatum]
MEANRDVDKPAEERIEDIRDVDPIVVPTENRGGEGRVKAIRIDVEAIIEPDVWSAEVIGGEDKVEASGNASGTIGDACPGTNLFSYIDWDDINLEEIDKLISLATVNANATSAVN